MNDIFKQFYYKELFLVGFYVSFIAITSLAAVIDYWVDNPLHTILDLFFVGFSVLFFLNFLKTKNSKRAARAILWIASILVFIFVIDSRFDMSIIFTLLLPIVAFILMPPREILLNMSLYYLVLISLLVYGYAEYSDHQILHNAKTMSAYFIASLFVLAFGLFYNFAIEESHRQLEGANRQKEILLKEIHHRIKNNLNIISSILGLQKLESNHSDIDRIIEQNRLRIKSISLAHEILYRSDDLEKIDFTAYMKQLMKQILITADKQDDITLDIQASGHVFVLEKMVQLGIIINELVTNSVKYALDDGPGSISLRLSRQENGYKLEYFDSGLMNSQGDMLSSDTLGLSLIKLTVEQMEGSLELETVSGYHYTIRFDV